jgi:peptide/nickel transport system ATP-binding protein
MDPVLSIQDLQVWYRIYGGYLKVVNRISLEVGLGEKIGLVGETGCGKTTTMKAVMRLLPVQSKVPSGCISFERKDILRMKEAEVQKFRRQGIAMIFQDPTAALNPVFTIGAQIEDVIRCSGSVKGKDAIHKAAVSVLENVALPDPERILGNYPFQLSGGMRQRICIALAISAARRLLIADEPTTSLDVTIQAQILNLIRKIVTERGTSLILITHSLGVAREMTDRIYVMYAGTVVETARTPQLYANPLHPYSVGLFRSVPRLSGGGFADGIPGRIPDYLKPPGGCRFQPRCPQAMPICEAEIPGLFPAEEGHTVACFLYRPAGGRQ